MTRKKAHLLIGILIVVAIAAAIGLLVTLLSPGEDGKRSDIIWRKTARYSCLDDGTRVCIDKWEYDSYGRCVKHEEFDEKSRDLNSTKTYEYDEETRRTIVDEIDDEYECHYVIELDSKGRKVNDIKLAYGDESRKVYYIERYYLTDETEIYTEVRFDNDGNVKSLCWDEYDEETYTVVRKNLELKKSDDRILYGDDWKRVISEKGGEANTERKIEMDSRGIVLRDYVMDSAVEILWYDEWSYFDDGTKEKTTYLNKPEIGYVIDCVVEYDARGRRVSSSFYSYTESFEKTLSGRTLYTYEDLPTGGYIEKIEFYSEGKPGDVFFKEYDALGTMTKWYVATPDGREEIKLVSLFDENDRIVEMISYWTKTRVLYEYDENGNCIKKQYYNTDKGYEEGTYEFEYESIEIDKNGAKKAEEFYDPEQN